MYNMCYFPTFFQVSPDQVHILDVHPNFKNIVVGCGFSGKKHLVYNSNIILVKIICGKKQTGEGNNYSILFMDEFRDFLKASLNFRDLLKESLPNIILMKEFLFSSSNSKMSAEIRFFSSISIMSPFWQVSFSFLAI